MGNLGTLEEKSREFSPCQARLQALHQAMLEGAQFGSLTNQKRGYVMIIPDTMMIDGYSHIVK